MEKTWPPVTIVISNLNGRDLLRECLVSVRNIDYPNYETLVADAGSKDGSIEMLQNEFQWVKLVEAKGKGLAESNNVAVAMAKGSLVVVDLNNDDCVERKWLRILVETYLARPNLGAVCGKRLRLSNPKIIDSMGGRISFLTGDTPVIGSGQLDSTQVPEELTADYIPVVLTTKKLYTLVGGCDPDYFIYFEDSDISFQIRRLGLDIAVATRARFYHKGSATVGKSSLRGYYLSRRNGLRFVLKNFPVRYALPAICFQVIRMYLRDTLFSIGPVNDALAWWFPSHRTFLLTRKDKRLALAQSKAILWNIHNLRGTLSARARAKSMETSGRRRLRVDSSIMSDPRF